MDQCFPYAAPLPQAAPVLTRAQVRMLDGMRTPYNSPDAAPPVPCTFPCPRGPCGLACGASGAAITRCQKHEWCPPTLEEAMLVKQYEVAVQYYQDVRLAQAIWTQLQKAQKKVAAADKMRARLEARAGVSYHEIFPRAQYHLGQPLPMHVDPLAAPEVDGPPGPYPWLPAPGYSIGSGRPSPTRAAPRGGAAARGRPRSSLAAGRGAVSSRSSAAAAAAAVTPHRRFRAPEDSALYAGGLTRRLCLQDTRDHNPYEVADADELADDLSELPQSYDGDDYGNPYDDADDDDINITN
jgi:hypothetical protein